MRFRGLLSFLSLLLCIDVNLNFSLNPPLLKASLQATLIFSKKFLFDEKSDNHLLIDFGTCFITINGWFEQLFMQTAGLYLLVDQKLHQDS